MIRSLLSACPVAGKCCGKRECPDLGTACLEEYIRCRIQGASSRQNVIDQPDARRLPQAIRRPERSTNIVASGTADELRLRRCVLSPDESLWDEGNVEDPCDAIGDGVDVVEAAMAGTPRVEGDAQDQIRTLLRFDRDPLSQEGGEMIDGESNRDRRSEGIAGVLESREPSS